MNKVRTQEERKGGSAMKAKFRKFGPRLTVSLTTSDYDELNTLAQKDEVSVSWVVRRAVEQYLQNHNNKRNLPRRVLQKAERPDVG